MTSRFRLFLFTSIGLSVASALAAPPLGDIQGTVQSVVVDHNYQLGYNRFTIYFVQVENDRYGCLSSGAVTVKDNALGVSPESFRQMFGLALSAQISGRRVGLSQAGSSPCVNVNGAWILD
jgi:hypothetical protein